MAQIIQLTVVRVGVVSSFEGASVILKDKAGAVVATATAEEVFNFQVATAADEAPPEQQEPVLAARRKP